MTFQDYRHIATGIDREFIRGKDANLDEDDDNDDDIHDLMAAHSSKLANARYARLGGLTRSLTSESIDLFRTISDKWQAWYKLETRRLSQPRIKMETESSKDENYTTRCINSALCKMYGQGAKFRNDQQRTAVMSAASGVDQLFVILPTGHGKSLTFMLPAMMPEAKTTVVITPLVALADDLLQRCRAVGIDSVIYGRSTKPRMATIVIIVTESAVTSTGMQFIVDIHLAKRLDRIVYDECHKLLEDVRFRPKLAEIKNISVGVQSIFLTATFPPTILARYQEHLTLTAPQFVRMVNYKLRTRYNVKVLNANKFKGLVAEEINAVCLRSNGTDKVLVFCRSKSDCEAWAKRWECGYYHSETENKSGVLEDWKSGLMFATGSLGSGVDIFGITKVIHIDEPYGMIDFDQEVGRGGRSGETVTSIVLLSEDKMSQLNVCRPETLSYDQRSMQEFLTTDGCRRTGISKYLNGNEHDDTCESLEGELCDNCISDLGSTTLGKRRLFEDEENSRQVRQRRLYGERQENLRRANKSQECKVQHALEIVGYLQGFCCVCWILNGDLLDDHEGKNCEELRHDLGMKYWEFRVNHMKYEEYSCCYRCGLPQKLCGADKSQGCKRVDVLFPLVITAWIRREELELNQAFEDLGDGRRFQNLKDYTAWMMKTETHLGYKGTNGFKVFERIVADRVI
jgi:superfamily II DNA helicase RecQ